MDFVLCLFHLEYRGGRQRLSSQIIFFGDCVAGIWQEHGKGHGKVEEKL